MPNRQTAQRRLPFRWKGQARQDYAVNKLRCIPTAAVLGACLGSGFSTTLKRSTHLAAYRPLILVPPSRTIAPEPEELHRHLGASTGGLLEVVGMAVRFFAVTQQGDEREPPNVSFAEPMG